MSHECKCGVRIHNNDSMCRSCIHEEILRESEEGRDAEIARLERENASLKEAFDGQTRLCEEIAEEEGQARAEVLRLERELAEAKAARDVWAHQCNMTSEAQADALSAASVLQRELRDRDARLGALRTTVDQYNAEGDTVDIYDVLGAVDAALAGWDPQKDWKP